jgi:DNA polymerase III subunit delta'
MWDIIGQDRAVSLLRQSLESGTAAHAYLFTGPEHVGKRHLAQLLAQALNCERDDRPCGECTACTKIRNGNHPDVQVIGITRTDEGAEYKVIRIEQVEEVQHDANLPPFEGRNKVFIVENAELLSQDAANRFLKTLEEPPPNVTFVLLTVNERLLPETVVSRCLRLELLPVPHDVIANRLVERENLPPEKADLLARLSHGCPGWALTAAGDDGLLAQRDEELAALRGLIDAPVEERFAWAAGPAAGFTRDRRAVYALLDRWADYWRDIMLVQLGRRAMITNRDRPDELAAIAASCRLEQARDYLNAIGRCARQLRRNVNPRLALEVLVLDIPPLEGGEADAPPARTSVTYGQNNRSTL